MEATKRTQESLEARVRETPLIDRLEQSQKRIGAMCSERRGPRMSIPVEHTDDDFFICTTLRDAKSTFDQAREALKELIGDLDDYWNQQNDDCSPVSSATIARARQALAAMEATHE